MTEPDVTLTDYGLAIECTVLAFVLHFRGDPRVPLRAWFTLFFASIGVAALGGGTVHGFFSNTETLGYRILWSLTLIAAGLTTMATWIIGAKLWFPERLARFIGMLAVCDFAVYSIMILFFTQSFLLVIVNYLPASFFLLTIFHLLYSHMGTRELRAGFIGLVLTLVAAAVQVGGIGLHPIYFSHNALYHVVQAIALLMIFRSARWLIQRR
jgi:hypothetical protein